MQSYAENTWIPSVVVAPLTVASPASLSTRSDILMWCGIAPDSCISREPQHQVGHLDMVWNQTTDAVSDFFIQWYTYMWGLEVHQPLLASEGHDWCVVTVVFTLHHSDTV